MKYQKIILVIAIVIITLAVLYFGATMLMGQVQGGHIRPPH